MFKSLHKVALETVKADLFYKRKAGQTNLSLEIISNFLKDNQSWKDQNQQPVDPPTCCLCIQKPDICYSFVL